MKLLFKLLRRELRHFNRLTPSAKKLLLSTTIYQIAMPITSAFLNVFLWRQHESVISLVMYNVGFSLALTSGFIAHSHLQKKASAPALMFLYNIMQGVVIAAIMFLPSVSLTVLFGFGALYGFFCGGHWGLRQQIKIHYTDDTVRNYYSSLDSALITTIDVIVPPIIGLFLELGNITTRVNIEFLYQSLIVLGIVILGISGWVLFSAHLSTSTSTFAFIKKPSALWRNTRVWAFTTGVSDGISWYLPVIIVLILIGQEGSVGITQGIAALISSVLIYQVGKHLASTNRLFIYLLGCVIYMVSALSLSLFFSPSSAFVYYILMTFADALIWTIYSPILYRAIEHDASHSHHDTYDYIVDHEVFLNLGRLVSSGLFCLLVFTYSEIIALRITPVLVTLVQVMGLVFVIKIISHTKIAVHPKTDTKK